MTAKGASCDPGLRERVTAALKASGQGMVVDGRFKGGWITRAYGNPSEGARARASGARELANAY
jgi:N-formylglutamate deformylase